MTALLSAALSAAGSAALAERLPLRNYTTEEGLAHDRVGCALQDSHGFLWFCTEAGISRFDGYRFLSFGPENGLPGPSANALVETGDGDYWVATDAGACRFQAATSRCVSTWRDPTAANREVNALLKDAKGRLWAGAVAGVFRSETIAGRFAPAPLRLDPGTPAPADVRALAEGTDGSVWIGGLGGVWRAFPDGRGLRYGLGGSESLVTALRLDGKGRLWIGYSGGLAVLAPEPASAPVSPSESPRWTPAAELACVQSIASLEPGQACHVTTTTLPRHSILALAGSPDGTLWAGTQNAGVLEISAEQLRRHSSEEGLTNDAVRSLVGDRDGNVWIGTESRGVIRLSPEGLVSYGRPDGLENTRVVSVFAGGDGALYVATAMTGGPLYRFEDGRFLATPGAPPACPRLRMFSSAGDFSAALEFGARVVMADAGGKTWMSSPAGLCRLSGSREPGLGAKAELRARYGAELGDVAPLFEDSHGSLWAAAVVGARPLLLRLDRNTGALERLSFPRDLPIGRRVTAFGEDRSGGLWVGFEAGELARLREGRFQRVPLPGPGREARIDDIHLDRSGRLWIAAHGNGLARVDLPGAEDPRAVAAGGPAPTTVHCIVEDQWGRLYIGTNSGVDRLDPASGRLRHYGISDGLASGQVFSAARDARGRLWFGTLDGVSSLAPRLEPAGAPPPIRIAGLRVAGVPRTLSALGEAAIVGLEMQADEAQIEVEYASFGFTAGERVRYRYRLEGADRDWGPLVTRRSVSYARLGPGAYRFLVKAVNADGALSLWPASVAFRVLPPLWRRWWFLSAAGLSLGALAYAGFRYRLNSLLALERVRTRIATDLHDDIGSSLSKIAILSEVAHREPSTPKRQEFLLSIAGISRELVDSMSDIVWSINPGRDSLRDLSLRMRAFGSEIFSALDISLRFQGPPEGEELPIGADVRRQVFLVFKEAVNNAASHSGCRNASVELRVESGVLMLRVTDDGGGSVSEQDAGGHGLHSMRERARGLGGVLELVSQPGRGTSVTLRVPIRTHRRPWGQLRFWRRAR